MIKISTVAFEARKTLRADGYTVQHATALELVAALLGYGTYAALNTDSTQDIDELFPDAEHVVFQGDKLDKRLEELKLNDLPGGEVAQAVLDACRKTCEGEGESTRFHVSMEEFESFIAEDVEARAVVDDDVLNAYADTNASPDEFYTHSYVYDPLADADEGWVLVATGEHTGNIDPDRMYSGHAGEFTATYTFEKDGRCGLVETGLEFGLDFSRSYE